jgi:hypothetical protein
MAQEMGFAGIGVMTIPVLAKASVFRGAQQVLGASAFLGAPGNSRRFEMVLASV